jgi:histidinol-phosphate/aromatic aminotransferase/cobyric acid decarboxylase-like protein
LDENKIVKLASNENPLGMPKSAYDAMLKAASDLGRYPDSNGFELKNVLSARLGVPADWITLGNGSNDSGAERVSEFLKTLREHKRKADSRKLPPDSKGALGYLTEAKKKVKK